MTTLPTRPYAAIAMPPDTEHLTFRNFNIADTGDILRVAADPLMLEQLALSAPIKRRDDAHSWIEDGLLHYQSGKGFRAAVCDKETGELVGCMELRLLSHNWTGLVGYWIAPWHRRKGYATQALKAVTDWTFTQNLAFALDLLTLPGNKPSQKVAVACGFAFEEKLVQYDMRVDKHVTFHLYCRSALNSPVD